MVPWPEMMTTSGRHSAVHAANLLQHIQAIAIGQPDVEQHRVIGWRREADSSASAAVAAVATP